MHKFGKKKTYPFSYCTGKCVLKALKECLLVKENTQFDSIVHIAEEEVENKNHFQNNSGGQAYPNTLNAATFLQNKGLRCYSEKSREAIIGS